MLMNYEGLISQNQITTQNMNNIHELEKIKKTAKIQKKNAQNFWIV